MINNFYISTQELEDAKKYWLNKLSGNLEEVKIPYGHGMKPKGDAPSELIATLDSELDDKLTKISKNSDILLYVYLLTAFKILLWKLSGIRDVCVSSPVYVGQNQTEEQAYNKFIFLRDYIEDRITFKELLMEVKQTVFDGYKNQYYPMDRMYELLDCGINTESSHNVCFHFMSIHNGKCLDEMIGNNNYHFIFSLEKQERLKVRLIFNNKVMDEAYADRILGAYKNILTQVTKDINLQISDIRLVSGDEIEILNQFNDTLVDFGKIKTIMELFEEQVNKSSHDVAVTSVKDQDKNYEQLTYKELNERANQLAHSLRKNGVRRGDIIGLMVHNSLDVAVGILGILKAGGAYMPIEPDYPSDRIRYMARDSSMKLLVTNCGLSATLPFEGIIINLSGQELTKEDVSNLDIVSSPDDPVYMIYTSGSTGKPKGIVVTHKNLFNYVKWRIDALGHHSRDVSLQLLSIAFDGFGTNFYPALLSGGRVVFVDNVYWRDQRYISEVISEQKVTNFSLVPLIYRMILENAKDGILKSLRFVVLAGEESDSSLIELSQQKYPEVLLVNEYGPTETTIATTALCGMDAGNIAIIGGPIANNKIYILDKDNQLMPMGLFGELCVSGEGVSKGYRNRADLTADKFIKNPYSENEILYKTGDLARWRQDGTIELLGRIDNQVKIMGCRIEPGEIESVLSGHHAINKTVVTTSTNGAGYTELCAFFTATKKISIEQLRRDLADELPEYMIPSQLIQLDEFPLMLNGKINMNALKLSKQKVVTNEYVPPSNDIEKFLTGIWEQVLQKKKIGINDNFFDIGGNSLLVMQTHSLIENVYPGVTTIPDLFAYPSISKLAEFMVKRTHKKLENTELYSIELPADYFNEKKGRRSIGSFKLDLSSDLQSQLNEIVLSENVGKSDVLLSAFVYLIAKITEKENVSFQAMMKEKHRISSICLDVKKLSSFLELFNKVNQVSQESPDYVYLEADWYKVNPNRDEGAVLPLFLDRSRYDGKDDLMRYFDMIFEVTRSGEEISLSCEYDSAYLREDKVAGLLQMYMKTIELMLHRVRGSDGKGFNMN